MAHMQEGEEDLRVAVERLRQDVQGVQGRAVEMQALVTNTTQVMDRANQQADATVQMLKDLQDKVHMNELALGKSNDDRREMGLKQENTVSQIWDQLRHVESSLAQRLTLAETSHVAAMQEVDEAKEGTSEVLQRVEDIKRHVSGLEAKLEGFSQAMVQAITPIHSTLSSHLERLEALQRTKQDAASAVLFKVRACAAAQPVLPLAMQVGGRDWQRLNAACSCICSARCGARLAAAPTMCPCITWALGHCRRAGR